MHKATMIIACGEDPVVNFFEALFGGARCSLVLGTGYSETGIGLTPEMDGPGGNVGSYFWNPRR